MYKIFYKIILFPFKLLLKILKVYASIMLFMGTYDLDKFEDDIKPNNNAKKSLPKEANIK